MVVAFSLGVSIPGGSVSEHNPVLSMMASGYWCLWRVGGWARDVLSRLAGQPKACPELVEERQFPSDRFVTTV